MTSPSSDKHPAGQSRLSRDEIRRRVLKGALSHVPFDGWTSAVLRQGAVDAGFEPLTALRVFPGGAVEAIEFWAAEADRHMVHELERRHAHQLKVRERVALAVRVRLEAQAAHREAVRRALGLLALPLYAPIGARTLWRTVDAMWYAAGDTATDFNYYTKRGLLAGVYSATVLYWLEDKSAGSADTWHFLERRIADVMRVPRLLGDLQKRFGDLPNPFRFLRPGAGKGH